MAQTKPAIVLERLAELMTKRGVDSDTELARLSGVSHDIIHLIRTRPGYATSSANAARLAMSLRCSLDYLMGLSDAPGDRLTVVRSPNSEAVAELSERMSESAREELVAVASALADLDRKRGKRAEEYERLIDILHDRMPTADYEEIMPLLLRAAWSNDAATFRDIIARYGLGEITADEQT